MLQFHLKARISGNGHLELANLPFEQGEEVEVTITPATEPSGGHLFRTALNGTPVELIDPYSPAVSPNDWSRDAS